MEIKRKTRKQGNSIILIPKIENYFKNASFGEFYEPLEWEDIESNVRELD